MPQKMLTQRQALVLLAVAIGSPLTLAEDAKSRGLTGTVALNGANLGAPAVFAPTPPPLGLAPEPAPAPGVVVAPQVECAGYMQTTTCAWTKQYSCPGQPLGSEGMAGNDNSDGYSCCCLQGLWQTTSPDAVTTVAPDNAGATGPTHWNHPIGKESIPRSVQLKHKLIQWFESTSQCPLHEEGGFPAWLGWKAVTAAAPAVTTPPRGIAGNRTLRISGFCPRMDSQDFTCVQENGEVKARAKENVAVTLDLDQLKCKMRDVTVYRMEGHLGVRFDFTGCMPNAGTPEGPLPDLGIKTASMNAHLEPDKVAPGSSVVGFTEFMLAVCTNGSANVPFVTANLPKFARSNLNTPGQPANNATAGQPSCFSETANSAHVLGKGCFDDFLFFDLQDLNGNIAKIPANDMARLDPLVTENQHWIKHRHGPVMIPTPAPAPSPVDGSPCATVGPMNFATARKLESPCDPQTTLTTTPFVAEVPGVVIADRICIDWSGCGGCINLCDCTALNITGLTTTTTTTTPPPMPCDDNWVENLLLGVMSFLVCGPCCYLFHTRCVLLVVICCGAGAKNEHKDHAKDIKNKTYKQSDGMAQMSKSMTGSMAGGSFSVEVEISKATTYTETTTGYFMGGMNFFSTGIICFIWVHLIWLIYSWLVAEVFGAGRDSVWNSIAIDWPWTTSQCSQIIELTPIQVCNCPFSLFPLFIALWLMNWLMLVYLYGWVTHTKTEECIESVGASVEAGAGQGGGSMFGY